MEGDNIAVGEPIPMQVQQTLGKVTHGICKECMEKMMAEVPASKNVGGGFQDYANQRDRG
jgi:hypothetical protein